MPRLVNGLEQIFTNLGIIGAGYKLFFFETTTTTPKTTYSNSDLTIANPNPVECDAAGRPEFDIWGADPAIYKLVLGTPDSIIGNINPIVTIDPVDDLNTGSIINLNPLPAAYWGTTTGTSAAYLLDALVPITSYSDKYCFFIDIHITNVPTPTLDVNDIGVINLKKYTGQGTKVALLEGDLQPQRYLVIIDGVDAIVLNPRSQMLYLGIPPTSTIATGAIILPNSASEYLVDNEGAAATDDLDTINGTVAGQIVIFGIVSTARIPTFKHNTGNLKLQNSIDFVPTAFTDRIGFVSDGTNLIELFRSGQGTLGPQLLQTSILSAANEAVFTNPYIFSSQFSRIVFEFEVTVGTDNVYLSSQFSIDSGSNYISANYTGINMFTNVGSSPAANDSDTNQMEITPSSNLIGNAATNTVRINVELKNPSNTTRYKSIQNSDGSYDNSADDFVAALSGAIRYEGATSAVNAIRFFPSAGTISGTINVRGYP